VLVVPATLLYYKKLSALERFRALECELREAFFAKDDCCS